MHKYILLFLFLSSAVAAVFLVFFVAFISVWIVFKFSTTQPLSTRLFDKHQQHLNNEILESSLNSTNSDLYSTPNYYSIHSSNPIEIEKEIEKNLEQKSDSYIEHWANQTL
jgi:hypothetical protein